MGKTRDLLRKIRDTKGVFHAKKGTIKDRNSMDLTEAEDIKKRWQDYTEELYKKDVNDPVDVHNLISGSSAFSKSNLNIWNFLVHILLMPGLEDFEHYLSSL